jgi:hypothetical protein
VDTERVNVRREPLVVRDGCAPERTPLGRWPSDDALVRSEQFAVNEAIACLADGGRVFGVQAPPGTGVAEVFGDLVAAVVTERARRIADLVYPAAAFGEEYAWGAHTVTAVAPELGGFEIVLTTPEAPGGPPLPGPGLPPIGAGWRDRAGRADYFAASARLADGVGAWAMVAARLGDPAANRAFAERWWHGAARGADVLFPAGEPMAAALRRLKATTVYWPECVARFKSAVERVEALAAQRSEAAAALTRLSELEQAGADASRSAEAARARLAELVAREPAVREAADTAQEDHRSALAALGAHELGRPELTAVTPEGVAALRSRGALSVALAGGVRRGLNWRSWSIARGHLRADCATTERNWEEALRAAETLRDHVAQARAAVQEHTREVSRLTAEMEPFAATVAAARQQWGDCVPAGPSQAETEDSTLIEWRETPAPWADEEYAQARAEAFIAALEMHKALVIAQADVFEANLSALMDLLTGDAAPAGEARRPEVALAAWQSFFLLVPVLQVPFEAAEPVLRGLAPGAFGWLLAAADASGLLHWFHRGVFTGDTVLAAPRPEPAEAAGLSVPQHSTAQDLADRLVRYGTWLPARPSSGAPSSGGPGGAAPRWLGTPLRVVRGQDRITVDRRNELGYDGLLITDRD